MFKTNRKSTQAQLPILPLLWLSSKLNCMKKILKKRRWTVSNNSISLLWSPLKSVSKRGGKGAWLAQSGRAWDSWSRDHEFEPHVGYRDDLQKKSKRKGVAASFNIFYFNLLWIRDSLSMVRGCLGALSGDLHGQNKFYYNT